MFVFAGFDFWHSLLTSFFYQLKNISFKNRISIPSNSWIRLPFIVLLPPIGSVLIPEGFIMVEGIDEDMGIDGFDVLGIIICEGEGVFIGQEPKQAKEGTIVGDVLGVCVSDPGLPPATVIDPRE